MLKCIYMHGILLPSCFILQLLSLRVTTVAHLAPSQPVPSRFFCYTNSLDVPLHYVPSLWSFSYRLPDSSINILCQIYPLSPHCTCPNLSLASFTLSPNHWAIYYVQYCGIVCNEYLVSLFMQHAHVGLLKERFPVPALGLMLQQSETI